ncbi:hypothetical protein EB796_024712 [Bugula neritina]|uniref:Uncharacterized protein n=1 Tax=Bugula neritina TaxID=10212 RepID=A0A7J7ISR7_BUGNE|nr:hypothetical protein EB796_024712 [Bugula neritina]
MQTANVHLLHAARQKGINNFTSASQPPFHAGPQQTAQFPSQTEKPAFSVANTATFSDSPQGAVDLLGNQDCDNASAVLQPVSITSHTPIMSSNVALSVPSSTPSSGVATPLLSSGGSSSGGHQHTADSQSHQLQRQQPTEANHATSADQQNYVVPDYSRQNLIPDSSYQQSSFDTLPSTAAPATQPKMVNVHMRGGTKSWLPSQTSSTSPNYHSIPIVAVSPQQKTSSAAEQTSNALPTSNLKTVDLHTSKTSLDWSLTTAKPPSNPLAGVTQSSSPRASGSRENASRSIAIYYEDSLQQFVAAVERYVKQLDTLTKPSLKGPTPLDTEWQDMLNEQEGRANDLLLLLTK